jgi:hypothetical protein
VRVSTSHGARPGGNVGAPGLNGRHQLVRVAGGIGMCGRNVDGVPRL